MSSSDFRVYIGPYLILHQRQKLMEATPAKCPSCRRPPTPTDKFCPNCGVRITAAKPARYEKGRPSVLDLPKEFEDELMSPEMEGLDYEIVLPNRGGGVFMSIHAQPRPGVISADVIDAAVEDFKTRYAKPLAALEVIAGKDNLRLTYGAVPHYM